MFSKLESKLRAFCQHDLLGIERERLELTDVLDGTQKLLRDGIHDLLACPGFLVVAKVEDLFGEPSCLPPGTQVLQEGRLACPAHSPDEHQVAPGQQALLGLEDVQVPAHESVAWLRRSIAGCFLTVVGRRLLWRERAHRQVLGLVLVDDRQKPIFQIWRIAA